MTRLAHLACCLAATTATYGADLESRFGPPFREVSGKTEKHPQQRIAGQLSAPWQDDSSWCDLDLHYEPLRENPAEGEHALRMRVKRLGSGARAQLALKDFPLTFGQETRIRFFAKSSDYTILRVVVGQKQAPYRTYWSQTLPLAAEWRQIDCVVPGTFDDPNVHFQFVIEQPGVVDLDHFRMVRMPSEETRIDSARLTNLLPNSSFPLGPVPPWITHGFAVAGVSKERGPTGAPAFEAKVRNQPGFARFEQSLKVAFRALPGKAATLRVGVKLLDGDVEMALRAGPPTAKIWAPPFGSYHKLATEWKSYEHTLELPSSSNGYYLCQIAFEGEGTIALDGVQITQAEDRTKFARSGPVEMALQAVTPYGLFGEGEPLKFRHAAWGDLTAARTLRFTLSSADGSSREIARLPLQREPYAAGEHQIPQYENFPAFGSFQVEATALDAAGKVVGVPVELLLHRVRNPRFADSTAPDSPFGIHYGTSHLDDEGVATMKKLGFNWLRLFKTFSWKRIEPQQGVLDFSQTDADVEILERHKMLALGILGDGAPPWAAKNHDPDFRGWACWSPRNMEEWAAHCVRIFERYGKRVRWFEPWNEPYYAGFFTDRIENGQRIIGSAEEYLALHRRAIETARASGHEIKIGWNTNALEELPRTQELVRLGIAKHTDFVSIHHYLTQSDPRAELAKQAKQMRAALPEEFRELPMWNTEGGFGPSAVYNLYQHTPPKRTPQHHLDHAAWYCKYYISSIKAGVERYFAYQFNSPPFWREDYSFCNVDGQISPILTSLSALAWHIDGTRHTGTLALDGGHEAELFEGSGRAVAVVQPVASPKQLVVPDAPGLICHDLFGNPLAPGSPVGERLFFVFSETPAAALSKMLKQLVKQ